MSTKRVLISGLILIAAGWVIWVSLSLWQVGDSLPELTSFERASVQRPAAADPETTAPADLTESPIQGASPAVGVVTVPAAFDTDNSGEAGTLKAVRDLRALVLFETNPSLENRCRGFYSFGVFMPETPVHPDVLQGLSDEEFKALVDSREGDGQLQRVYAQNLRAAAKEELQGSLPRASLDDDATIREYDVRAVRGRDWNSAAELVVMHYDADRVESSAWWQIMLEMGYHGGVLAPWHDLGRMPFTDQEHRDGVDRAEELINELELLPGLGVPEECLTPDDLAEQRSHVAALVRRLAQRAMPSEAPDEPPQAFNRLNGHALVVENVCSFSCPTDVQRVIYFQDVPDTDACALVDGVEQTIQARTPVGRYEERTFCVPAFLAEN